MSMLPDRFWKKEILEDCKGRRALAMKFLLPLVLLSPLAMDEVPIYVKAVGMALAVLFIGVFGSAVGLARLKENAMIDRLAALPISPSTLMAEYILANALMDGLQLLVPFVLIARSAVLHPYDLFIISISFVSALVAASALGVLAAAAAGSSAEVHLYSGLIVLAVGAISNSSNTSSELLRALGPILPFWQLSESLLYALGSGSIGSPIMAPISGAVLLFAALIASPKLFRFG